MIKFKNYLIKYKVVSADKIDYYVSWVKDFYIFSNSDVSEITEYGLVKKYALHLQSNYEDWKIVQAKRAIRIYHFYLKRELKSKTTRTPKADYEWKHSVDKMIRILRLKHRSFKTEQTYVRWTRSFYKYLKSGKSPYELGNTEITDYLSY